MLLLRFDTVFTLMLKENKRQKIITFDIFHVSLGQFFSGRNVLLYVQDDFWFILALQFGLYGHEFDYLNICTMHGLVETLQTIEAALFKGEKVHKKQ